MRLVVLGIAAALLLHAAPALACKDGEYSLLSYTKGDKYELDKKALELKKQAGTPDAGSCVDCNNGGPYAERKKDLDARKKRLRELRKNAEDEGKAVLQEKFRDARAEYDKEVKELRAVDSEIAKVDRQLREATTDAQRSNLREEKKQLEEKRQEAVKALHAAKAKLDGARNDLQKFQAMIEAIKKEIASLERQASELNQARNSCPKREVVEKPCPPNPPGTVGQCR
jgi:DNA repair exonuclease SbcCD ATPase subunit